MNMELVICVCLVIITVSFILLIGALIFILREISRIGKVTEKMTERVEKDLTPVLTLLHKASEDIACVTDTVRSQMARVDVTADHISQRLLSLTETVTKTGYLLHDAVAEPLIDLAAFLRGFSRGVKFFFADKKK